MLEGETVLICEGERDCEQARELGFPATTCAEGAGKWRDHYTTEFRGGDVVLIPDGDDKGRSHMEHVARSLGGIANSIKIVDLPGLAEGGDLSDWVEKGESRKDLETLLENAKCYSSETIEIDISDEFSLPFKTGREIADSTPVVTEWLAYPWFPRGVLIEVSGKIKIAGKTTWIAHAAGKILDGAAFMGESTKKTKVLYLTEQPPNSFRRVLRDANLERDDIKVLYWHEARSMEWEALVRAVGHEAREFGAGLIIIDVISRWASFPGVGENTPEYADKAIPSLKELAAEGFTVLYARHDRKSGGDVGESGRGTSQLGGDVDQMFQLSLPPGANNKPNVRVLSNTGRFMDDTPHTMNIELTGGEYRCLGSTQDFAHQNAIKVVPEILPATKDAAITSKEVVNRASAHGVKRTACTDALKELSGAEDICRVGEGKKTDPHRYYKPALDGEKQDSSEIPIPIVSDESNTENQDPLEGVLPDEDELPGGTSVVRDHDGLGYMIETLKDAPEIALDIETYPQDESARSLDPRRGHVGVITLAGREQTFVIDRKAIDRETVFYALSSVLSGKPIIAHNAPFDLSFLRRDVGYEHRGPVFDTLVLDAMLFYATGPLAETDSWRGFLAKDKQSGYRKSLADVAEKVLDLTLDKTEQSADWGAELSEEMISYAAEDAAILLPLKDAVIAELENLGMTKIVDLESRFTPAMTYCMDNGFALDVEGWREHARQARESLEKAKAKCDELAPEPPEEAWVSSWNASNHRKVGRALELLGAKVEKKKGTGNYVTGEAELKAIKRPKKAKELAAAILEYRQHEKFVTTWADGWFRDPAVSSRGKTKGKVKQGSPDHLQVVDGRVYTKLNQLVATGRGSSRSPNLQNLPSDLRRYFVSPAGRQLLVADYQQMEYCAAAYLAGDEALLEPLRKGKDFHTTTAEMIGVDRRTAKTVNFGLLYGMSGKSLAARLGVSRSEAEGYISAIRDRAPGLAAWCDEQTQKADRAIPYAMTPLGRIRLVDQNYRNYREEWVSSRSQMLNHPVQGACADGYKIATALLWERQDEFSGNPLLVNMIHDEFVVEVDTATAEVDAALLDRIMVEGMREAIGEDAPVRVDVGISEIWTKD